MMDYLLMTRGIERILITLSATVCIYLGYRLLLSMPQSRSGEGKVELPLGTSIVVSRVGPGVFFGLFGSAMLCVALFQTLRFENPIPVQAASNSSNLTERSSSPAQFAGLSSGLSYLQSPPVDRKDFSAIPDEVFADLYLLNEIPRNWKDDLNPLLETDFRHALTRAKMLVLRQYWAPEWTAPAAFQDWVLTGAIEPLPPNAEKPWQLFNHHSNQSNQTGTAP